MGHVYSSWAQAHGSGHKVLQGSVSPTSNHCSSLCLCHGYQGFIIQSKARGQVQIQWVEKDSTARWVKGCVYREGKNLHPFLVICPEGVLWTAYSLSRFMLSDLHGDNLILTVFLMCVAFPCQG